MFWKLKQNYNQSLILLKKFIYIKYIYCRYKKYMLYLQCLYIKIITMDYQDFQNFIKKYDFDQKDLNFLNEIMKTCILPSKAKKPVKKLYSLRLNEEDVAKIKEIAKTKWIPYQTLISSIIHQYVS